VGEAPYFWVGIDTWELNIDNSAWVHYIRGTSLYISDDAGETFTPVSTLFTGGDLGAPGWCIGFPSAQGQFYLGALKHYIEDLAHDPNPLLYFTQDGGETWHDWTHNLWDLITDPPGDPDNNEAGVLRFNPHPMEQ
jgi:hypothetical protein